MSEGQNISDRTKKDRRYAEIPNAGGYESKQQNFEVNPKDKFNLKPVLEKK